MLVHQHRFHLPRPRRNISLFKEIDPSTHMISHAIEQLLQSVRKVRSFRWRRGGGRGEGHDGIGDVLDCSFLGGIVDSLDVVQEEAFVDLGRIGDDGGAVKVRVIRRLDRSTPSSDGGL